MEIDARTPYGFVVSTLYSLSQAGFEMYLLAVDTPDGTRCLPNFSPPAGKKTGRSVVMLINGEGASLKTSAGKIATGCEGPGEGVSVPALGIDAERQPILDLPALTACMTRLKGSTPELAYETQFRVAASSDMHYRVLVDAIGAVRRSPDGKLLFHDFLFAVLH